MPKFGTRSMSSLSSCERDIQTIFQEVVKFMDCSIVEGHRTAERQHEHWQKGRALVRPDRDPKKRTSWKVVDKKSIVTSKDGYEKLSRHQKHPSSAVDVVPYPSMWSDMVQMHKLAGAIDLVQNKLLAEGKIEKKD